MASTAGLLATESLLQAFIIVESLLTERDLVQALSLSLIDISRLDVFRARSVCFDGPPTKSWYGCQSTHHPPLSVATPRWTTLATASRTRHSVSFRSIPNRDVPPRGSRCLASGRPGARRGHGHRHPLRNCVGSIPDGSPDRMGSTVRVDGIRPIPSSFRSSSPSTGKEDPGWKPILVGFEPYGGSNRNRT